MCDSQQIKVAEELLEFENVEATEENCQTE